MTAARLPARAPAAVYGSPVAGLPTVPLAQQPVPAGQAATDRSTVDVVRSSRRRRTVSAYRDGDRTVVLLPARLSAVEEERWVATMLERLAARESRLRPGDVDLEARAAALSRRYLGARLTPVSVRWVGNQNGRWGSCTPVDRTIRLSRRLMGMPPWVVDYVLLHELAHLQVPGHGADFWALVATYPRADRARGYLEGVAAAAGLDIAADGPDEPAAPAARIQQAGQVEPAGRAGRAGRDRAGRAVDPGQLGWEFC